MDSLTYRAERERECEEVSASWELKVAEEVGSAAPDHPPRCRLLGRAHLNDQAFVDVHEIVELHGRFVHRVKYAYYLSVGGREIGGYERDPIHNPAEHRHCSHAAGHIPGGEPAPAVSFKEAVALAWEWLSEHGLDRP